VLVLRTKYPGASWCKDKFISSPWRKLASNSLASLILVNVCDVLIRLVQRTVRQNSLHYADDQSNQRNTHGETEQRSNVVVRPSLPRTTSRSLSEIKLLGSSILIILSIKRCLFLSQSVCISHNCLRLPVHRDHVSCITSGEGIKQT